MIKYTKLEKRNQNQIKNWGPKIVRRDEVQKQFLKNRRSGDSTAATFDPGFVASGDLQQNLRKLLRTKYRLINRGHDRGGIRVWIWHLGTKVGLELVDL